MFKKKYSIKTDEMTISFVTDAASKKDAVSIFIKSLPGYKPPIANDVHVIWMEAKR